MSVELEEYVLSTLEETAVISEKDGCRISIVKDSVEDVLYVKRQFDTTAGINIHKALLGIAHSNLPKIFHVIEAGKGFIVVEEYIRGITLKTGLKDNMFFAEQVANTAMQLCDALDVLHKELPDNNISIWTCLFAALLRREKPCDPLGRGGFRSSHCDKNPASK